jgi:hypothetical protein
MRFSTDVFDVEHGGMLCIDALTGQIDQTLNLFDNNGNHQYVPNAIFCEALGSAGF